jgi:hypothetical protein
VPQEEHLAVVGRQPGDGLGHPPGELAGGGRLAGGRAAGEQRAGEGERREVGGRLLPADVPAAAVQVAAVGVEQPLVGGLAGPQVERHGAAGEELGQAAGEVGLGVLDDVRRVEAGGHAGVEVHGDERGQGRAVAVEQLAGGGRVAGGGAVEEPAGGGGVGAGGVGRGVHTGTPAARGPV